MRVIAVPPKNSTKRFSSHVLRFPHLSSPRGKQYRAVGRELKGTFLCVYTSHNTVRTRGLPHLQPPESQPFPSPPPINDATTLEKQGQCAASAATAFQLSQQDALALASRNSIAVCGCCRRTYLKVSTSRVAGDVSTASPTNAAGAGTAATLNPAPTI